MSIPTKRLDSLESTVNPQRDHEVAAMRDGISNKLRVEQILALLQTGDIPNGAVTLAKLAPNALVDVASATTADIGAVNSLNVRITGTVTIEGLGTAPEGAFRRAFFAASLTLTHNATSLILPSGASITTAAGDVAEFVSLGLGNWRCVDYQRAAYLSAPAQNIATAIYDSSVTLTATIPGDDTIPQNTEGTEIITVSHTPSSATAKVKVTVSGMVAVHTTSDNALVAALFVDGESDARHAAVINPAGANLLTGIPAIEFVWTPGDATERTYKLRAGATSGNMRLNGTSSGRVLGGAMQTRMTVEEVV